MKLKTLIVTVVVLAALSAVVFIVRRPAAPPSADARLNQALVDQTTIEKAAKLRLSDQGKIVTLTRQSDGTWQVPEYYGFPVDFQKLSGFVGSLTEAKLQRLVTSSPERIARLEFKDTKIELLDSADKVLWTATLGKKAESGEGRYVRFGEEPKAFLAALDTGLDVEPKNWANPELLNLKPDDIAKIEVAAGDTGPLTLSRSKKEDPWTSDKTPAGQRVRADPVSTLLSSLGNIRFTETTDPTDANAIAARSNGRNFKLTTFDGKTVTVALGRKPEEKKLKPPSPTNDGKSGPAALGSATDLLKSPEGAARSASANPLAPEFETVPAGPVFASIVHSDPSAPVNSLMQKRAFQVADYTFTNLPQKAEELFEPVPAAPASPSQPIRAPDEKAQAKE